MTAEIRKIVLGTRGSKLARAQARLVEKAIQTVQPEAKIETKIIATQGDKARVVDPRAGRKGVFTAEIERALPAGEVDVAVHSAKDLPSETSPDAEIAAVLSRAPMDDVLVSKHLGGLASLPEGATVATGSVRPSTLSISAATYLRACENWRKTNGTPSFWRAPDYNGWAYRQVAPKSALKAGNFFLRFF